MRTEGAVALLFLLFAICLASRSLRAGAVDGEAGQAVFAKRCSGCHAADTDKEGPRLRGVAGRKAGSVAGFLYSDALKNSGVVSDEARLERWLENPQAVVKDNDMEFRVANPAERAALVLYLKGLK